MNPAEKITDVLKEHAIGYTKERGSICVSIDCDWWGHDLDHPNHVATEVIAALGLSEETNAHYGDRYTDDSPATRHRFVTGWTPISEDNDAS